MITNINEFKKFLENMVTMQQDNKDKISITLPENIIVAYANKFFKKRKLTMKDIKGLGSSEYDALIKYLSTIKYVSSEINEEINPEDKDKRNNLEDMLYVGDFEV